MENIDQVTKLLELSKQLEVDDSIVFDNDYGVYKLTKLDAVVDKGMIVLKNKYNLEQVCSLDNEIDLETIEPIDTNDRQTTLVNLQGVGYILKKSL